MPIIGAVLCLTTCQQESTSRTNDTVNIKHPPAATISETLTSTSAWDLRAGRTFAIPAPGGGAAYLIFPAYTSEFSLDTVEFDLRSAVGTKLQLLRDGQQVALAQITTLTLDRVDDCTTWPSTQLAPTSENPLPAVWTVGIDPTLAVLPIDSLAGQSGRDSVRLTVALARLASALPGDTAAAFRGRPFVVRHALQFSVGTETLILAEIVRTMSQEAMPLQEHLLLIARADSSERAGFRQEYFERTIGVEDATETTELLAIVRAEGGVLLVLVSRDLGDGLRFGLLE